MTLLAIERIPGIEITTSNLLIMWILHAVSLGFIVLFIVLIVRLIKYLGRK